MKITEAENRFFDLVESGAPITNKTTSKAKCGRAYSTVMRRLGMVKLNKKYAFETPITQEARLYIKQAFIEYNNTSAYQRNTPKEKRTDESTTDEQLIARLKYITDQLRARGYDIEEIKITYTI